MARAISSVYHGLIAAVYIEDGGDITPAYQWPAKQGSAQ